MTVTDWLPEACPEVSVTSDKLADVAMVLGGWLVTGGELPGTVADAGGSVDGAVIVRLVVAE